MWKNAARCVLPVLWFLDSSAIKSYVSYIDYIEDLFTAESLLISSSQLLRYFVSLPNFELDPQLMQNQICKTHYAYKL